MVIAGDLTDAKDYHVSTLTNRIVAEVDNLRRMGCHVEILMGNHDYLREGHAYFDFLSRLGGVRFITSICDDGDQAGPLTLFLPHTKTPVADWQGLDFSHFSYVFMHQTAPGSVASNGQKMDGEALPSMKGPKVYSGDIHVPQVLGDIEYIGSPYHVHFGDRFTPRAILIDSRGRSHDLHFDTISRVTLTVDSLRDLKRQSIKPGDQIKLRIKLSESDKHEWHRIKREASTWLREQHAEVHDVELVLQGAARRRLFVAGVTPASVHETDADAVLRYVLAEELGGDALDIGLELVK